MAGADVNQAVAAMLAALDAAENLGGEMAIALNIMEYQGFEPNALLRHLEERRRAQNIGDAVHRRSLFTLAILGTVRGSNLEKITQKSTDALRAFLQPLVQTYGLVSRPGARNNAPTLVRLAACFVRQISLAIFTGNIAIVPPVTPEMLGGAGSLIPRAFCLSSMGSLIPNAGLNPDDRGLLIGAFCYHQYCFDGIINPRQRTPLAQIMQYVTVQVSSNFYTNQQRLDHMMAIGIIVRPVPNVPEHRIVQAARPFFTHAAEAWHALGGEA